MTPLERSVSDNWFDLREHSEDLDMIEKNLNLTSALLNDAVQKIKISVEQGIIEYKRQILNTLFSTLESLQYDSRNITQLKEETDHLSSLLYTTVIQRNISSGIIELKQNESYGQTENEQKPQEISVKEIIKELSERVKKDPDFQNVQEVKNIFTQIKLYQREMAELINLKQKIPQEKLPGLAANFKTRFDEINLRISDNYKRLNMDEKQNLKGNIHRHPLKTYDLKTLTRVYWDQAKLFSKLYSVVVYIEKERFQIREHIVNLITEKESYYKALEKELSSYITLTGTVYNPVMFKAEDTAEDRGLKMSRLMCLEIIKVIEKQVVWRGTKHTE